MSVAQSAVLVVSATFGNDLDDIMTGCSVVNVVSKYLSYNRNY